VTSRRKTYPIRARDQIRALTSPVRQELVDALQASGPSSIADLATELGRAPDSLYYHVRRLEAVGLVVRRGTRSTARNEEALFDTPGARMRIERDTGSPRESGDLLAVIAAVLRLAKRDLSTAFARGLARYGGARRNTWGGRVKGWLTPAEVRAAGEHIEALTEIFATAKRRPGAGLHAVTWLLTPLQPTQRTRNNRQEKTR